jgi:hypothetical protein
MTMVRLAAGLTVLAALSLTGCSDARRALGYDKAPPDEFTVVARAPLAQPPDFTLRPPAPGAPRPQEGTTRDQAKGLLVGNKALAAGGMMPAGSSSPGVQAILTKSGADHADPDIRRKVNEDATSLVFADEGFTDKLLFWRDKPTPGEPLDPTREQARLKGEPAIAPGSTSSTSLFGSLFGGSSSSSGSGDRPVIRRGNGAAGGDDPNRASGTGGKGILDDIF